MENTEAATMDVVVHKASIALSPGESLDKFISKLSDATRAHATKKFLLNREKGDFTWMVEAFGSSVITSVSKDRQPRRMYAMAYSRDSKTKEFKFGDPVEVERKTSFAPVKATVSLVSKAATTDVQRPFPNEHAAPKKTTKAVEQLDVSRGQQRTFGNETSRWVETSKSFWNKVL